MFIRELIFKLIENVLESYRQSLSTLQEWGTKINLRYVLLDAILRVMDISGISKKELQIVIVSFNKIKVQILLEIICNVKSPMCTVCVIISTVFFYSNYQLR